MPKFGKSSESALATAHPDLVRVARRVIELFDHSILEGHRGEAAQNAAFKKGLSQQRWPHGKHNAMPSNAIDIAPYPVDWSDTEAARQRFVLLAGYYLAIGATMGIALRWGGDWDGDDDTRDERFRDYGHIERIVK